MRIFSIIVAALALIAGGFCISIISKFRELFLETGPSLPNITASMINTSGWIPGGILITLAIIVGLLLLAKNTKYSFYVALITMIFMAILAFIVPIALLMPLSKMIRESETNEYSAEQAAPSNR